MGDHISVSISLYSPLDETFNRGPLALLLRRQYEFPFRINIEQFFIIFFRHRNKIVINFHLSYLLTSTTELQAYSKEYEANRIGSKCVLLFFSTI